jgi:transposase
MRPLRVSGATSVLGLQQEIQRSEESRYDHRLHGVLLVAQGMTCPEVARLLGDAPRSVENWVHRFNEEGLAGLMEGERPGRPSRLDEKQMREINRVLRGQAERRRHASESLGWQDASGLDRQDLYSATGCASVPAVVPAVGVPPS